MQDPSRAAPLDFLRGAPGRATVVLIALRIAYAYNWFDVGPGLPNVSQTFGVGPADWGLLLASFLVGAGVLQVPAGLLSLRFGARGVSLCGALLLGAADLAAAGAPNFLTLVLLRAAAGAGGGLFFSPAISLVAGLHPEGRRGVAVGTFSSAFSAGAALGVFVSALVIPEIGWRGALALGAVLLLTLLALAAPLVPGVARAPTHGRTAVPAALRSRAVWCIGLAFMGVEGASLSAGQYFVPFAEATYAWAPALAGGIASLFVFPSFFGGPIGGALTERFTNRRTQLVAAGSVCGAMLLIVPHGDFAEVVTAAVVFALSSGSVYAMMYVLAPYLPGIPREELPLVIGLFNAIQIAGGALVTFVAALIIARDGYTDAWFALAALCILPLGLLAGVPITGSARGAGTPDAVVSGPPGLPGEGRANP
ncbi:MAG: MFS transporter [Thermoplasmata archaeon]|nr:MFS transporter [Thermoplasmata archaeon]